MRIVFVMITVWAVFWMKAIWCPCGVISVLVERWVIAIFVHLFVITVHINSRMVAVRTKRRMVSLRIERWMISIRAELRMIAVSIVDRVVAVGIHLRVITLGVVDMMIGVLIRLLVFFGVIRNDTRLFLDIISTFFLLPIPNQSWNAVIRYVTYLLHLDVVLYRMVDAKVNSRGCAQRFFPCHHHHRNCYFV